MNSLSRTLTLLALAAVPFLSSAQTAPAPAAAPAAGTVKLETFNVTGTFLKRLEQENALPVTIVNEADLKALETKIKRRPKK